MIQALLYPSSFQPMPWGWLSWVVWGCVGITACVLLWKMIQWNKIVAPLDIRSTFLFPMKKRVGQFILMGLIFGVLGALLTWRPISFKELSQPEGRGHNIFFLVDVSSSMNIEDTPPSRLEAVKRNIEVFVRQSGPTHAYGLMVFASSIYFVVPLTTDIETFIFLLNHVEPGMLQDHGTRIADSLTSLLKLSEEVLSKAKLDEETQTPYFVVISDGEDFSQHPFRLGEYEKYRGQFIFLGIGKDKSMPVPVWKDGKKTYLYNSRGELVMSRANFDSLRQLAEITGGVFTTFDGNPLQDILGSHRLGGVSQGSISRMVKVKLQQPQYGILGAALLALVLIKLFWRYRASVWLWAIGWGLIIACLTPAPAYAQSPWTYWRHEKAKQDFQKNDMPGARKNLQKNLSDEDVRRIEEYNLGVVAAEEGNLEEAQRHFSQVESGTTPLDQLPPHEQRAKINSTFNQGVLAYRQGKDKEALQYFKKSLNDAYDLKKEDPWVEDFKENTRRHISKILKEKRTQNQSSPSSQGGQSSGGGQDSQKQKSLPDQAQMKQVQPTPSDKDISAQDTARAEELKKRLMEQKLKQEMESTNMHPMMIKPPTEEKQDEQDSGPQY